MAEVRIEKLVHRGAGLARVDGRVWLIPFTVPGDLVRALPTKETPGLVEAEVAEVLEPGPDRVVPPCPVFGRCGGCQLQQVAPDRQPAHKAAVLAEVLLRVGKIDVPDPEVVSGAPWGYRARVELHARDDRVGYYAGASRDLVEADGCPIAAPALSALFPAVRDAVRASGFRGEAGIELVQGHGGEVGIVVRSRVAEVAGLARELEGLVSGVRGLESLGTQDPGPRTPDPGRPPVVSLWVGKPWKRAGLDWSCTGRESLTQALVRPGGAPIVTAMDPRGFAQANAGLNPRLVATLLDLAAVRPGDRVLELYAGAGNFSLGLAAAGANLTVTEVAAPALALAQQTLASLGLAVTAIPGHAARVLDQLRRDRVAFDLLVADPPRTGMEEAARPAAAAGAARVVICSCDPATLARDLKPFAAAGFIVTRLVLVDMFPQTFHIEAVVRLDRG